MDVVDKSLHNQPDRALRAVIGGTENDLGALARRNGSNVTQTAHTAKLDRDNLDKTAAVSERRGGRAAQDVDRVIGERVRMRRVMLGMSQQQLADVVGVTYQQAHKYERGLNRISASRLLMIAKALNVDVTSFFEGLAEAKDVTPTPQQRMLLELGRNFAALPSRRHQLALCDLARMMALDAASDKRTDNDSDSS